MSAIASSDSSDLLLPCEGLDASVVGEEGVG